MSDTSQGDGWWQASDGKFYPPESLPAPPLPPPPAEATAEPESKGLLGRARGAADKYQDKAAAAKERSQAMGRKADEKRHGAGAYTVAEGGKNGAVKFEPGRLVRTLKKTIGRDDIQTIPLKAITSVSSDRRMGKTIITLVTPGETFKWKVSRGEEFEAELNEAMYGD